MKYLINMHQLLLEELKKNVYINLNGIIQKFSMQDK